LRHARCNDNAAKIKYVRICVQNMFHKKTEIQTAPVGSPLMYKMQPTDCHRLKPALNSVQVETQGINCFNVF
jgi:hypothetical protein